ncbi:hypothetical protein HNY73_001263 [Argiope bruennichi]|uniref:Granulins domain-containing protein n=1 Tax=Argiope bruennichi TaxID=94029 RepID=A0A8T0G362_ARGBR|nr:hypothetical protein HNY73_001263 [Argiope bruennichi]
MKVFLLLLIVPCLVACDTQCPDSTISCPDDKKCCEVNGQHSCCDIEDDVDKVHILEGKMKVYPGEELLALAEHLVTPGSAAKKAGAAPLKLFAVLSAAVRRDKSVAQEVAALKVKGVAEAGVARRSNNAAILLIAVTVKEQHLHLPLPRF